VDSAGTATYKRDGAHVTAPVVSDGFATYTPGISERRSSTTKYYGADRLGTNSLETNSSQAVTATKTYDAFGMPVGSTGSSASPFGFAGQHGYQEDGDSGLKLLGHRYYDAGTGRFLTRDPIKAGRNWYGYCDNNPLQFIDPTGLKGFFAEIKEYVEEVIKGTVEDRIEDATEDWLPYGAAKWAAWPILASINFMANSVDTTHEPPDDASKVDVPPIPGDHWIPDIFNPMPQKSNWNPESSLADKPNWIWKHHHPEHILEENYDGPFGSN